MPNITKDLGPVTGYAIAVAHGYTGTEAQWIQETLATTQNAQTATQKAAEAAASESAAAGSADAAGDSADAAEADALKAEGNAVGQQNGVDVADGQYFHNNAKYYAQQAEASKVAAAGSETAAGTAAASAEAWANGTRDGELIPSTDPAYGKNAKAWASAAASDVEAVREVASFAFVKSEEKTGRIVEFEGAADNVNYDTFRVELPYAAEPYEKIMVRNTGRNIWGGAMAFDDFLQAIPEAASRAETDRDALTVDFIATNTFNAYSRPAFKDNARYTVILTLKNSLGSDISTNVRVKYTNNTTTNVNKTKTKEKQTISVNTTSGKSVEEIIKINQGGRTVLYMAECGAFEGIDASFTPFVGGAYTFDVSDLQEPIYGGVLDCVNLTITSEYNADGTTVESPATYDVAGSPIRTVEGYNIATCAEGIITAICNKPLTKLVDEVDALNSGKQDLLTFDNTPTENSENPVTSGGIYDYVSDLETIFTGNVETAVSNWLENHPEAVTTVPDNSLSSAKFNADAKAWIRAGVVNVKDYGAVGDGVTDDSTAILAAIAALPSSYGVLYFPPGLYIHGDGLEGENGTGNDYDGDPNVGRDIRFMFDHMSHLTIIGNSAEIRSNDGNGECPHNAILNFYSCSDVLLCGVIINGRRAERGLHMSDGNAYNRRGNIHIYGCNNVCIHNVKSINSAMDGAYVGKNEGARTTNLYIRNCDFSNAHRNGLSLGCVTHARVENVIFDNAGTSGDTWNGTNPKAGIDVEADYGQASPNEDIIINACQAYGCAGVAAFTITAYSKRVTLSNCTCDNKISVSSSGMKDINIVNNRVFDSRITMHAGGILCGNTISYDASKLVNGTSYNAIISSRSDGLPTDDILLIYGNRILIDAESIPENLFANFGWNIQNEHAVIINNVFQNPLWGYGEDSPVVTNGMHQENNTFWQKTVPAGYKTIT